MFSHMWWLNFDATSLRAVEFPRFTMWLLTSASIFFFLGKKSLLSILYYGLREFHVKPLHLQESHQWAQVGFNLSGNQFHHLGNRMSPSTLRPGRIFSRCYSLHVFPCRSTSYMFFNAFLRLNVFRRLVPAASVSLWVAKVAYFSTFSAWVALCPSLYISWCFRRSRTSKMFVPT